MKTKQIYRKSFTHLAMLKDLINFMNILEKNLS